MFNHLPVDASSAFRLSAIGTVLHMLELQMPHLPADFPAATALGEEYRAAAAALARRTVPSAAAWAEAQTAWQGKAVTLPASRLAAAGFGPGHLQLLVSLALVEEDPRLALLIEPEGGMPSLGGLVALWRGGAGQDDPGRVRDELLDLVDAAQRLAIARAGGGGGCPGRATAPHRRTGLRSCPPFSRALGLDWRGCRSW